MKPSNNGASHHTKHGTAPSSSNPTGTPKLYRPMLLRFRCIGGFSLLPPPSTTNNDSSSTTGTPSSSGSLRQQCRGIRSRLLPLGEYPAMTAEEALDNFRHAATHERFETTGHDGRGGFGGSQRRMDGNGGRAEDGGDGTTVEGLPHVVDPKWMELQQHVEDEEHNDGDGRTSSHVQPRGGFRTILPPRSRMDFYGSTEIGVLLLRPHDKTHPHDPFSTPQSTERYGETEVSPRTLKESLVYAVSPQNTLGLAVREINIDDEERGTTTGGTFSTVKVGVVEVSLASRHEGVFVDDDEEVEDAVRRGTPDATDGEAGDKGDGSPTDLAGKAEGYYDRIVGMGGKLGKSMSANAAFLSGELQDDFPNRFMKGGEKVVNGFGKHLGRMEKLAGDLYSFFNETGGEGCGGGGAQ